jgi:hypothetical protein
MDSAFEVALAGPRGGADTLRRLLRSAVVVALFGSLAAWGTTSALASGPSGGFAREALSVRVDAGAIFSLPALAPGQTVTRYATVTSTGPPASIRLYATVTGNGLARFLTLTVIRGTGGADAFEPVGADRGAGPGVVYSGGLDEFPTTWAGGVDAGRTTGRGESQTFLFEITLSKRGAGQGLSAGADFRWEARQA